MPSRLLASFPRRAAAPCFVLGLLCLLAPPCIAQSGEPSASDARLTPAERSEFRATPSYDDTLAYIDRLAEASPYIHRTSYGVSAEGREMPLVVVSRDKAFNPSRARFVTERTGKPVVLIQNGIHAGEIDGKDASLMLLRDLALGRLPEVLDGATLLIVPIYNVDGHERVSPYNRANQDGPVEGMGFRTTTHGLDLNRDHLKAETAEARAVLDLFNRWRPHLHVDDHVTNGSDHDWVLTWGWAEPPQLHAAPGGFLARHMPAVLERTEAAGHPAGPYISLNDGSDPTAGFSTVVGEPRYATGYYPLRHRPSILVEMHAYKPYEARVRANHRFLVELLTEVAAHGDDLVAAVAAAEADTVAAGRTDAEPADAVVTWKTAPAETYTVPFREWSLEPSVALGVPLVRYGETSRDVEVPWIHAVEPDVVVARPRGYLVPPGWPQIEARLTAHGLRVERLAAPAEVAVEEVRVSDVEFSADPYQGQHRVTDLTVERIPRTRLVPADSLWIPADQPDFEVAIQLLEPEAADSLFSWGYLSSIVERKEYISAQTLEPLVQEMLEDPAIQARWKEALEADPDLEADPGARWMWWYRQTPYWDDTVGLLPVWRVQQIPAGWTLEPWPHQWKPF